MLPANIGKTRKPRKDALYSREEINVIAKYKQEYRDQTTQQMRAEIMRSKILVDLFNYWLQEGTAPTNEDECTTRMKELAAWVRNNWRPISTTRESNIHIKVNPLNVIWETQKEAVEDELKEILGVDELDNRNPGYFQQRNAAAKRVLGKMSEQDRAELNQVIEERKARGHPEAVKRDRAQRHGDKIIQRFSKERWLDMGMSTVIFTVHTDQQGRLVADVHDDVLGNMGLSGRSFVNKNENQVTEMKRSMLEFMKAARANLNRHEENIHTDPGTDSDNDDPQVKMTAAGYPILPNITDRTLSKMVYERLLRAYLSQHYYLASSKKIRQVPYAAIRKDIQAFISDEYLPDDTAIQDPRNMRQEAIQKILQHWWQRQEGSGPESAFRFSKIIGPHKMLIPATYRDTVTKATSSKSKGKEKEKESDQLDGLYTIPESLRGTPTPTEDDTSIHPNRASTRLINHPTQHSEKDDLVIVDMRGMAQLREMGCAIIGPVNGPNEGPPQYLVPKSWVDRLTLINIDDQAPETQPYPRPRPRPRPIATRNQDQAITAPEAVIDPALMNSVTGLGQEEIPTGPCNSTAETDQAGNGQLDAATTTHDTHDPDDVRPDSGVSGILNTPPLQNDQEDHQPDPGPINTSQTNKRPIDMSPTSARQNQSKQKRRVVRDDERAAMEAQKLIGGRRSKRHAKRR